MKKRLKNISSASGKKKGADILICAIIFTFSLGTLSGCSSEKDNTEDTHGQFGVETSETKQLSGDYSITIGDLKCRVFYLFA